MAVSWGRNSLEIGLSCRFGVMEELSCKIRVMEQSPAFAMLSSYLPGSIWHLFKTLSSMVCWHISNRTQRDGSINVPLRMCDLEIHEYTGVSVPKLNRLCSPQSQDRNPVSPTTSHQRLYLRLVWRKFSSVWFIVSFCWTPNQTHTIAANMHPTVGVLDP